jgi:hypothetical protein
MSDRDDGYGSVRSGTATAVDHCREASDRGEEFGARGRCCRDCAPKRNDVHPRLVNPDIFAATGERRAQRAIAGSDEVDWETIATARRSVRDYLDTLDEATWGAASETVPKCISKSDPATQWTGAHKGQAFFAYANNYLIDLKAAIIMDVKATLAIRQAEVGVARTMIKRSEERQLCPERVVADGAYGTADMLGWLVDERSIEQSNRTFQCSTSQPVADKAGMSHREIRIEIDPGYRSIVIGQFEAVTSARSVRFGVASVAAEDDFGVLVEEKHAQRGVEAWDIRVRMPISPPWFAPEAAMKRAWSRDHSGPRLSSRHARHYSACRSRGPAPTWSRSALVQAPQCPSCASTAARACDRPEAPQPSSGVSRRVSSLPEPLKESDMA